MKDMEADLYGVGVGPGDPELITLKGVKALNNSNVIFTPESGNGSEGLAISIVSKVIDLSKKEVIHLHLPMTRDKNILTLARGQAVAKIIQKIEENKVVSFISLGDPLLYSTFSYLMTSIHLVRKETRIVVIPGVSSITASAGSSLVTVAESEDKVAIIPASEENFSFITDSFSRFETIILMKVNRNIDKLIDLIEENGQSANSILVSRCGREGEHIVFPITSVKGKEIDYFTTILIKTRGLVRL